MKILKNYLENYHIYITNNLINFISEYYYLIHWELTNSWFNFYFVENSNKKYKQFKNISSIPRLILRENSKPVNAYNFPRAKIVEYPSAR